MKHVDALENRKIPAYSIYEGAEIDVSLISMLAEGGIEDGSL